MLKRMVLGLVFALLPSVASGKPGRKTTCPPRASCISAGTAWTSIRPRSTRRRSGKMMQGRNRQIPRRAVEVCPGQLQNAAQNEPKVGPLLKDFTKLVGTMHKHGLVLGIEVEQDQCRTDRQAVMVFPKAAGESGTLLPLIHKIAEEAKADVKNAKVGKRFVHSIEVELVKIGWWAQGSDAVLYLGTTDPVAYAKDIDAKKTGLAKQPALSRRSPASRSSPPPRAATST